MERHTIYEAAPADVFAVRLPAPLIARVRGEAARRRTMRPRPAIVSVRDILSDALTDWLVAGDVEAADDAEVRPTALFSARVDRRVLDALRAGRDRAGGLTLQSITRIALERWLAAHSVEASTARGARVGGRAVHNVLDASTVRQRVGDLGRRLRGELKRTLSETSEPDAGIAVVSILSGSIFFTADLSSHLRELPRVEFDFVRVKSTKGDRVGPTGILAGPFRRDFSRRHVVIVDDIVETGGTLRAVADMFATPAAGEAGGEPRITGRPLSIRSVVLLQKGVPACTGFPVDDHLVGFHLMDERRWLVGYGMDYLEEGRELPYVGALAS